MKPTSEQIKNESQRMDAFTDGVFGIVATLLVLDIKLPTIPENHSQLELMSSLKEIIPSLIAFSFSFLTVIIYWINHDHISKWMKSYNQKVKYFNLLLLFWICLIPFPTKFISEYPNEQVAVMTYGVSMLMVSLTSGLLYRYIAFKTDLLNETISTKTKKQYGMKIIIASVLYAIAVSLGFIHVYASITFYILIPVLFVFLPKPVLVKQE